ncbi:formyltetrahydrofolate deformylase [Variovorax sp. VNK109]|uniref:formyltetrahydrofolate deformylase n=1 Tax=Variovorax sp. VNK109 TaxID=3400919 RepID=UPI003C0A2698
MSRSQSRDKLDMAFILTLACPDRPGIVHAVSALLVQHGYNITEASQASDRTSGRFFMRVAFDATDGTTGNANALRLAVATMALQFDMAWELADTAHRMRTLILVSKLGHCLNDLVFRWKSGLLPVDIRGIVSNHDDHASLAASYGIPFHLIAVTPGTKALAETQLMNVVKQEGIELMVLARYMQILSADLCTQLQGRVINIHHSFLPSFKGASPYRQAYERGVKLVGATAHYVTADLDEGPIIEQGIVRVDHTMNADALTAQGRDVECAVLARAVRWHAEHRILRNDTRTVVFR